MKHSCNGCAGDIVFHSINPKEKNCVDDCKVDTDVKLIFDLLFFACFPAGSWKLHYKKGSNGFRG